MKGTAVHVLKLQATYLRRTALMPGQLCLIPRGNTIYVRESERKSGIGKALYASLEKALAAQNMTNLNACIASPVVDDEYLNHNSIQFISIWGIPW